jgi:hypothetical protein
MNLIPTLSSEKVITEPSFTEPRSKETVQCYNNFEEHFKLIAINERLRI